MDLPIPNFFIQSVNSSVLDPKYFPQPPDLKYPESILPLGQEINFQTHT
jgi:hypothetical protein